MTTHKILVIDDSMVIRRTVKDMLPEDKFEVIEAKDGVQGMDLIENANPDLIMLDFFLPKMSGWDVYQEIQKELRYKTIPLLLMSGRKDEVTEKIPEPFEFFAFLEKPFAQKQLILGIREAMEKSKKLSRYMEKPSLPEVPVGSQDTSAMAAEIVTLNNKVANLEAEIVHLKKQLHQVVNFMKQKLK
jgi:DNA-binding response OmpR family regulator